MELDFSDVVMRASRKQRRQPWLADPRVDGQPGAIPTHPPAHPFDPLLDRRIAEHGPFVKARIASFTGGDSDLTDDLAQETWIRVATRLTSFRGSGNLRAWVLRVCTRICIDRSRREAVRRRMEEGWSAVDLSVMTETVATDAVDRLSLSLHDSDQIANAVVALPPRRRAMIIAEIWFENTPRQIAATFRTTPARVWKELSVARARLRIELQRFRVRKSWIG